MTSNFLIGPIKDGLRLDIKPWATPEDSFEVMENAYQFRGRILRRPGYTNLGQLSFQILAQNVAASAQNFTANLFSVFSLSGVVITSGFSTTPEPIGFITITVNGGSNYTITEDPSNPGNLIQTSGIGIDYLNGSINYLTGALVLNFSSNPGGNVVITFSYAYMLPVMGLRTRELFTLNAQDLVAFDTKYAYRYSSSISQFQPLPSVVPVTWNGSNFQFFYTINYAGSLWTTNNNPGINGWAVQSFATAMGTGTSATVQVTAAGNTAAVNDFVYFINLAGSAAANNLIFAKVTLINTPGSVFTVQAISYPPGINSFVSGVVTSGLVLDSMQAVAMQDGVRYYADTAIGTTWVNYNPPIDPNNVLAGALLIFAYRGYLVFLNTTEGNDEGTYNYGNRARWSQIGTPYYSSPDPISPNPQGVDPNAMRDDLFGRGGANDAPTQEVIVGAGFIKDILVVYFERSTWRLRFVNNAQNPFIWERINVELGASATFSTIPFDKGLMAIGERGIVISDPNDTIRFDEKIPDTIFAIRIANQGMQRVCGIRTFRTRLNYWTYPSVENENYTFPDQVLVYNYETKNWSFFDDSFTTFGYYYSFKSFTWADLTQPWSAYDWLTWEGGAQQAEYENIVAGNQQGFVLELEQTNSNNGNSLYITAITNGSGSTPTAFTSPNNNLSDGTWITLTGLAGTIDLTGVTLNGRNFKVVNPSNNSNVFKLQEFTPLDGGLANGSTYDYNLSIPFIPVLAGSVYIAVGSITFTDNALNGSLIGSDGSTGSIDYNTGVISLAFASPVSSTEVYIRVVSVDSRQGFANVFTTGTYAGGGYIEKISNFDIQTKIFNFLPEDKRSRLSTIDFYTNQSANGQFTTNIFTDSSEVIANAPLLDNPQSNTVLTTQNPYQFGSGEQTMFRLYADVVGQTIQAQFTMSDQQQAVNSIADADLQILALNFRLRKGGRLV